MRTADQDETILKIQKDVDELKVRETVDSGIPESRCRLVSHELDNEMEHRTDEEILNSTFSSWYTQWTPFRLLSMVTSPPRMITYGLK